MTGDIAILAWCDLAGAIRVRAVPESKLDSARAHGVGFPAAGQAMLPFGEMAENPWGPTEEVRHRPVAAEIRIAEDGEWPALHLLLTQAVDATGELWNACPRGFCERAMEALEARLGWRLMSAFEFEFIQTGNARISARPVYTLDAFRTASRFVSKAMAALERAKLLPASIEPEYGPGQLELSTAVFPGISGPDNAILTRELLREISRREAWPVTFAPKVKLGQPGNGQHIHFSFNDRSGEPVLYDPDSPALISSQAASFVAGIMDHMRALCAIAAPSPVSYLRLGPNHWSCGYTSFGVQNREAAIRVCSPLGKDREAKARTINLEFRPPDSISNPYLVLGMLIHAGLDGVHRNLPLPPLVTRDPAELSPEERIRLGVVALPASLEAALEALENDLTAKSWLPEELYKTFVAVRRKEVSICAGMSDQEICDYYSAIY